MGYFVTGATGFIGRNLVELLLEREGTIYVLVREGSKGRLEELRNRWGADEERIVGIVGDLSERAAGRLRRGPRASCGRDVDHLFHLAAIYDMTRERREPAGRERRGHPAHGPVRRGGRGRARPHGELDRRRRPLPRDLARGHVRGGPGGRQPPLLPDQARVRGRRPQRVLAAVARLPARDRRRQLRDRRDGQGRRPLLLLQAHPPDPRRRPAVAARAGDRGSRDQHRPGRLRGQGDGPHRPHRGPRRSRLQPHRPEPAHRRRGDRHLRPRRARPADLGPAAAVGDRGDRAGGQGGAHRHAALRRGRRPGARRLRHPALGAGLRQLPDPLRLAPDRGGARGHRDHGAAARGLRGQALGLLGAPPRPGSVPRPDADGRGPRAARAGRRPRPDPRAADPRRGDAVRPPDRRQRLAAGRRPRPDRHGHRRLLGDRQVGGAEDRRRRRHRAAGRPHAREARADPRPDPGGRRHRPHPPVRPLRPRGHRPDGRGGARPARPRRRPDQQRRAARSGARSRSPTTARTTSSARSSSTTSARCG